MVQRIKKLRVSRTDTQDAQEWAEVLSHRNKLLQVSEWTQLPDSGLAPDCVTQWRSWRAILKNIRRSTYPDRRLADRQIKILAERQPFNVWENVGIPVEVELDVSMDVHLKTFLAFLSCLFNTDTQTYSFRANPMLVEEQYREAVEYLAFKDGLFGSRREWPLLAAEAKRENLNKRTIAKEYIRQKEVLVARLLKLREAYNKYIHLAFDCTTPVELRALQEEAKKWISTLT